LSDSWELSFNYHHSSHQVKIDLKTQSEPAITYEFPWAILALTLITTVALAFVLLFVFRGNKKSDQPVQA